MRLPSLPCRLFGIVSLLAWSATSAVGISVPETLNTAAQIRALTVAQAAQAVPVHLRGVMISEAAPLPSPTGGWDYQHCALVLSDPTAAIYVAGTTNLLGDFHDGDWIEIDGVTDPGQFAPFVSAHATRRLGTAPIPAPQSVTYHKLITGGLDAQWVEISGVVRSWEPAVAGKSYGSWLMVLAVDGNKVTVTAYGPRPPAVEPDAEVRIRSVCFYQFNQQRQVLSPTLVVPRHAQVEIVRPAPAEPFAPPAHQVAGIFQFDPDCVFGHRIHVQGTVLFQQSERMFWLRDKSGAAGIQLEPPKNKPPHSEHDLHPGDEVDVLGFPQYGSGVVVLEDALFNKRHAGTPPAPLALSSPEEAFKHDGDLIAQDALLTDVQSIPSGESLTLQADGKTFTAVFNSLDLESRLPLASLAPGSRVRVAGICLVNRDNSNLTLSGIWHPQSFQILLRSPADLQVIVPPSWWTPSHIILLLGGVVGGLLLVGGTGALLARRRLIEQKHQRAMAEAEFAAILTERNRMAREIHDTLAQGLTAISFQLRLAKKGAAEAGAFLNEHLDTAQELVRSSLAEARNSIWNMRSQVLETHDLPGALGNILKQMSAGLDCQTELRVTGQPRRLAPVVENNLLRFGQEAITNAIRHAHAGKILVQLDFGDKQLRLSVQDNGCGFDATKPPKSSGGFGLLGIRERAKELQGAFEIQSAPGQGTTVSMTFPIAQ